ncbi:MAG: hypothetical protein AB7D96_02390 [Arcobacteraceae bacterium]
MQIVYNKEINKFELIVGQEIKKTYTQEELNNKAYALSVQITKDCDFLNNIYNALQTATQETTK